MDSRKSLYALLAGAGLAAIIGILLTPYKNSSRRERIVEKAKDYADSAEETIKDSAASVKKQLKNIQPANSTR